MTSYLVDYAQRLAALDPSQSFIIQAPAGSGKTELLTQRYLKLLSLVENAPEQIIAITFTRKAAREMRARIYAALVYASTHEKPNEPHKQLTWELAKKALERNAAMDWELLNNPNRLCIQTIDSLCAHLTTQMPILTQFGTQPNICEDPLYLYQQTVDKFLQQLESNVPWASHIFLLLSHLDNNMSYVKKLLIEMLQCRDQWLPHLTSLPHQQQKREVLESALQAIVRDHLQVAKTAFEAINTTYFIPLIRFAAQQLRLLGFPIDEACLDLKALPEISIDCLEQWRMIATLLLTKENQWRKTVNQQCGFPSPSQCKNKQEKNLFSQMKSEMVNFLTLVTANESLRQALENIQCCPLPYYTEEQWHIINALTELLPLLAAQLLLTFRQLGKVDFIQMATNALTALGELEDPTDLTLKLDYKIQHLLVDEFQDTSYMQYRLLEKLTGGWQAEDGRTLFFVGDPMQSIYRFRQAEVGLFIKTWQYGFGSIALTPLKLETNFRSSPNLIEWFNATFSKIFPPISNYTQGAIHYTASSPGSTQSAFSNIEFHPVFVTDDALSEEAAKIVEIINHEKQINTEASIAILVRTRSHLNAILSLLKQNTIDYQAIEIEQLYFRPVIQDLFALTRALMHLADRIAWLSLLRGPWCGLTLKDIYLIANNSQTTLWQQLNNPTCFAQLSAEGQERIQKLISIFNYLFNFQARLSLSAWIKKGWHMLIEPVYQDNASALQDAKAYFIFLHKLEQQTKIISYHQIAEKLDLMYASSQSSNKNSVQVMTIHKAKGLEFDVVIVPKLHQRAANNTNSLMMWMEKTCQEHEIFLSDLIIAPIKAVDEQQDKLYEFIRQQCKLKDDYETMRLFYVAVTRAKGSLHLTAEIKIDHTKGEEIKKPLPGSFLSLLWPNFQNDIHDKWLTKQAISPIKKSTELSSSLTPFPKLKRIALANLSVSYLAIDKNPFSNKNDLLPRYEETLPQTIGTVTHRLIKQAILFNWNQYSLLNKAQTIRTLLLLQGTPIEKLEQAIHIVLKALCHMFEDKIGLWILDHQHQESHCEFPVTMRVNEETKYFIIDRTFIDKQNIRWIIDYKIVEPLKGNQEEFLQEQYASYKNQLENYAMLLAKIDSERPIHLGLYFPLCKGWIKWIYNGRSEMSLIYE